MASNYCACQACGLVCPHRNRVRLVCHFAFVNEARMIAEQALNETRLWNMEIE